MIFTDDDLKRLKHYDPSAVIGMTTEKIHALLARLEASERIAVHVELNLFKYGDLVSAYVKAWRKACGKDKA